MMRVRMPSIFSGVFTHWEIPLRLSIFDLFLFIWWRQEWRFLGIIMLQNRLVIIGGRDMPHSLGELLHVMFPSVIDVLSPRTLYRLRWRKAASGWILLFSRGMSWHWSSTRRWKPWTRLRLNNGICSVLVKSILNSLQFANDVPVRRPVVKLIDVSCVNRHLSRSNSEHSIKLT